MRTLIQRVSRASVSIEGRLHSEINAGILVLLGIEDADDIEDIKWLASKISKVRIFDDDNGIMNLSINEIFGEILVISQFTLHASTKKGNRPSYIKAAKPDIAVPLYEKFIEQMSREVAGRLKSGVFGAMMSVELINEGPVTIFIDSKNKE